MRRIAVDALALEPQVGAHADEMFTVLSDPAIYAHENEPPESAAWLHDRFVRLESRTSADGQEAWLNWVVRLPSSELAGYVQATVYGDGRAAIAYVLSSRHWGRGLARRAVQAMIAELGDRYGVHTVFAVLKESNDRSRHLLERLGFTEPSTDSVQATPRGELLLQRRV